MAAAEEVLSRPVGEAEGVASPSLTVATDHFLATVTERHRVDELPDAPRSRLQHFSGWRLLCSQGAFSLDAQASSAATDSESWLSIGHGHLQHGAFSAVCAGQIKPRTNYKGYTIFLICQYF